MPTAHSYHIVVACDQNILGLLAGSDIPHANGRDMGLLLDQRSRIDFAVQIEAIRYVAIPHYTSGNIQQITTSRLYGTGGLQQLESLSRMRSLGWRRWMMIFPFTLLFRGSHRVYLGYIIP